MEPGYAFEHFYHRWTCVVSLIVPAVLILASPLFPLPPVWGAFLLSAGIGLAMGLLLLHGLRLERHTDGRVAGRQQARVIHAISAIRSLAAVMVLFFVGIHGGRGGGMESLGIGPFLLSPLFAWVVFAALAAVETTDYLDGQLARRHVRTGAPPSPFGPVWDMENDAVYALALSYAAWQVAGIPIVVLIIGVMRYFYFLLVRAEGDPPGYHPAYKLFAKSTTATLMIALIVIYVPVVPHALRGAFVYGALGMQVISFSWDLVLRARADAPTVSGSGVLPFSGRRRI